jgi:hypothetical protein
MENIFWCHVRYDRKQETKQKNNKNTHKKKAERARLQAYLNYITEILNLLIQTLSKCRFHQIFLPYIWGYFGCSVGCESNTCLPYLGITTSVKLRNISKQTVSCITGGRGKL